MELGEHDHTEPPVADCDCRRCAIAERDSLRKLARDAYTEWDADNETKVGKLLRAMLDADFRNTYRPDLRSNAGNNRSEPGTGELPVD